MAERVVVQVIRRISNRQLLDRLAREAGNWTPKAMDRIRDSGKVPIDTGALRADTDTQVSTSSGDVVCKFHWRVPYADYADRMADFGRAPRTPGTRSPYGVPGVKDEVNTPEFKAMIKKALGG